jgi:hypothetical protein
MADSAPAERSPVTFLTTPKRFSGIFATIQTNAVTSWTHLEPRPDVILFGDDEGTDNLAAELGVRHVPDVARNDTGTPLLSDMWQRGQQLAATPVVCWSNADVMFTSSILDAARLVADHPRPALLVGRRHDIDVDETLPFTGDWQDDLRARVARSGERKPANWIDYFVFTRGLLTDLPPFAIGRPGYDQWMIWKATELGADVIDASRFVDAIHQRHDYSHAGGRTAIWTGAEAKANDSLVGDWRHYHSIAYARWVLDDHGTLRRATDLEHRLARPKRYLAHALRFTRPLRIRLLGEQATRRRR